MRIDYPDFVVLHARARRERAEAVYRLLITPVVRLFHRQPAPSAPLRTRLA
jgi:hypothetical protein